MYFAEILTNITIKAALCISTWKACQRPHRQSETYYYNVHNRKLTDAHVGCPYHVDIISPISYG